MTKLEFSWRVPSFPVSGETASQLINEIVSFLGKTRGSFDAAWMDDHFHPWLESLPNTAPVLECWTTLTYLSGRFPDLDYSGIVLCNSYRNPAYLAKSAATLSCLTGGRFVLGIGAGWKEDEYLAYGYPFPSAKGRIEQLEEGIKIIREMWAKSPVTFQGKYFRVKDAFCVPGPVGTPPIMVGGSGEKLLLGVVARQADWWNLHGISPETYEHKSQILEKHCSKANRNPSEIRKTWGGNIAIAETESRARELASSSPFSVGIEKGGALVGTPESVTTQIQKFVDVGVTYFHLRFLDFPSTAGAELFGKRVAPAFSKGRA